MEKELKVLKQASLNEKNRTAKFTEKKLTEKNKKDFSLPSITYQPNLFQYLPSLNVDQFNIILDCALPYIHVIHYPDCVGGTGHRRIESATELLLVLTICRHELHQGIMGYIVGMSNTIVQRLSCAWVLATLFNKLDLKLPSGKN